LKTIVVGITGASGAAYAARFLEILVERGVRVQLVASDTGISVFRDEAGVTPSEFAAKHRDAITYHDDGDLRAPIASGSYRTDGMAVVPATMDVCGAIASGLAPSLLTRAAAVTMKEGRRLVVVPRETPMSAIHLERLAALARVGVIVLPACPGFYGGPKTISHLVDFIVQKICDALMVEAEISPRWS